MCNSMKKRLKLRRSIHFLSNAFLQLFTFQTGDIFSTDDKQNDFSKDIYYNMIVKDQRPSFSSFVTVKGASSVGRGALFSICLFQMSSSPLRFILETF